ncbi:MAG: type I glyceraldehyde-3-phosphate dehydrogenase [Anaerolineales bacterium]|nr:type I glyceraldehyde-3-phosphate dehydrogenase [Anaerolineales bacterium]MBS3753944.1 type I glyceraldehyde-3-phosphate dehydrogenase [Anaerolineales bacterium]
MSARVALNGFGRIGRAAFRQVLETPELELVAFNDIAPLDNLAYLLRYDTAYGRYDKDVEVGDGELIVDGKSYKFFSERNPEDLPWEELDIDLVLECTGIFRNEEGLEKHLKAGADYVILSAPAKSEGIPTVVHGVNEVDRKANKMVSCASCTTNSIAPPVEVMDRRIGIEKAILTTIHGYTSTQQIVDGPSKKIRRGRAAAVNFVPTSTGAAIATTKVLPEHKGKFNGIAVRGPIPVGSVSDITFLTSRKTDEDEINQIFREEAKTSRYKGILGATDDPIVSADIVGDSHAATIDLGMTMVVDGDLVKLMSWYDNEWGFTSQMIREAVATAKDYGWA